MTMPHERTRAMIQTGELLEDLRMRDDLTADIKRRVSQCLRHYPSADEIRGIGLLVHRKGNRGRSTGFALHENYDTDRQLRQQMIEEPQGLLREALASRSDVERAVMFGPAVSDLFHYRVEAVAIGTLDALDASNIAVRIEEDMGDGREVVVLAYTHEDWQQMLDSGNGFTLGVEAGLQDGKNVLLKGDA